MIFGILVKKQSRKCIYKFLCKKFFFYENFFLSNFFEVNFFLKGIMSRTYPKNLVEKY